MEQLSSKKPWKSNKLWALGFTCSLFMGIFINLAYLWVEGAAIEEAFFSQSTQWFLLGSCGFLILGLDAYRLEVRKGFKGYKLHAFAIWLAGIVLFDIWMSPGEIRVRDIALLVFSCLIAGLSIWKQWGELRSVGKENHAE